MPEAKVTAATVVAALMSIVFAVARRQPVDAATLQTVLVAVATFAAGWIAPHTARTQPPGN